MDVASITALTSNENILSIMPESIYERLPAPGLLADGILVVHALIVLFVIAGLVLTVAGGYRDWRWTRNPGFRLAHLATIGVVVAQAWLGRLCPLTVWEAELRRAAGQAFHEHGFIQYWVGRLLFYDLPWWVFVVGYTVFGLAVVASWWRWPPRYPGKNR